MSWLSEVFEEARRGNWCTRIRCTTCRADRLRCAVLGAAMKRAGVRPPGEPVVSLDRGVANLTAGERRRVVDHIIIGLRKLDVTSASTDALRLVLYDLHPPLLRWGVGINLHDELLGTPAGDELRRMEDHAAALARARQAQRAFESAEAVRARREERRVAARARARKREKTGSVTTLDRLGLIADLEALSSSERLRWLADRDPGYPLEIIPSTLLPLEDEELTIETEPAVALLRLIDRRGGAWGRLARRLHQHLLHPAYFQIRFRAPEPLEAWADNFAIISAYATTGETWTDEENRAADRRLHEELMQQSIPCRPITGFSRETGHAEQSWAAVLSIEDACQLGRRFRQDAIFHVAGNRLRVLRCAEPRRAIPLGGFRERLEHDPAETR